MYIVSVIECGCHDDAVCKVSGQCPCDSLETGRTCDTCIGGTFGDPPNGIPCQVC